ncbi:hypothetical protein A2U01_0067434, partial [Trifolium medium]|nr:hypothetical protein [Trifolium medium]
SFPIGRELSFARIFLILPQYEATDVEISFDDPLIMPDSYFLF